MVAWRTEEGEFAVLHGGDRAEGLTRRNEIRIISTGVREDELELLREGRIGARSRDVRTLRARWCGAFCSRAAMSRWTTSYAAPASSSHVSTVATYGDAAAPYTFTAPPPAMP